ncbi:hypothetical protein BCY91_11080 [Pelobium manganitolerans]|uniref:Uncharacterized protein n=1 Tax=Pelobium manganitolerans TaxID=1842495 RepID=A0A419S236_9SPHI|nr:hypothetical protein [Pelobium manganitolerans]RKD12786.1 hypothetical protein BCY91_11080 [Pelobium manganitolerans]
MNISKPASFTFWILLIAMATSCSLKSRTDSSTKKVPEGSFRNLGVQLRAANLQATAFIQDQKGEEYAYTVVRGRPGHLIGYKLSAQKVIADLEIITAEGAIDMVASTDHWLYIGASNGHLYRTRPGSNRLENLGKALEGTAEIMDMEAGADGEVFGGTFPTGKIFRYHPKDGFSDVAGQIVEGENYVKSLIYQNSTGNIYAGVGSHARLVKIDMHLKTKKELLPREYQDREFVYDMGIVEGATGGDRLLAWVTGSQGRDILVYNLQTHKLEQTLETLDAQTVLKAKDANHIYYTANGKLYRSDIVKTPQKREVLLNTGPAKDMRWGKDGLLHFLTKYGEIKKYNPATKQLITSKIETSPQPYGIQTLVTGPDGKIWSSGYLLGGNAVYDPQTGESKRLAGLGQAEGMVAHKNSIYFGIYPKARVYRYDVNQEWNPKQQNPALLGYIKNQDRPFATASLPDQNKVFFGTVSGYGKLGGALAEYDVESDSLFTYSNIIPDQSIASLLYKDGILWCGTTIFGGLGAKPTQAEGKIFVWDVHSKKIVREIVPAKGGMAVTCLADGPNNTIWGFVDGSIFVINPRTGKVLKKKTLFKIDTNPSHIWRVGFLQLHKNGLMYGAAGGNFFKVDPRTMDITILKTGVGLLSMDPNGTLYTRDTENLWSYTPKGYDK